jgi:hypothetical protein
VKKKEGAVVELRQLAASGVLCVPRRTLNERQGSLWGAQVRLYRLSYPSNLHLITLLYRYGEVPQQASAVRVRIPPVHCGHSPI